MTKKEQFYKLLEMPQTATLRNELVEFDEDVLKEVYTYLMETGRKKTMQSWIRMELAARIRQRMTPTFRKGASDTNWARRWSEQWEEARQVIRNKVRSNELQRIVIVRGGTM